MNISKGNEVIYLPTNERGKVTKVISDDIFYVRINGELEDIPVVLEDLLLVTEEALKTDMNQKVQIINDQYVGGELISNRILPKEGMYLACPYNNEKAHGETMIPIILWNNFPETYIIEWKDLNHGENNHSYKNSILKGESIQILAFYLDDINDKLSYELCFSPKSDVNKKFESNIILKPSTFFKTYHLLPFTNESGYIALIKPKATTDLFQQKFMLTPKSLSKNSSTNLTNHGRLYKQNSVLKAALFNPILDLHAEKLIPNYLSLRKGEILEKQLKALDKFLEEAIQYQILQVFVIHGVGTGKLKSEIANKLINHPKVNTFKNEFHPQYGFGATEILLY